jgi:hypothetical protein
MTTATNNPGTNTNGDGNGKQRAAPTAIEAITRVSKILDQLSPTDRKRVLAFINETNE